jgi:hypothetical protein
MRTIIILVSPAGSPGSYVAELYGEVLCRSRTPFLAAARRLIERGFSPAATLVMRWAGSSTDALRGKLGIAAGLTVIENDRAGPAFRRYSPPPECRLPAQGGGQEAVLARAPAEAKAGEPKP